MQGLAKSEVETIDILDKYRAVRAYTEYLCEPLEVEDYIPQPVVDVSPARWNIAHTTWFFEEMVLKKFVPDYQVFDERFGFLFNSYYNTIGERTPRDNRGALTRPTVAEVFAYRKYVDEQMEKLLAGGTRVSSHQLLSASGSEKELPLASASGSDSQQGDSGFSPNFAAGETEIGLKPGHSSQTVPLAKARGNSLAAETLEELVVLGLNHEQQHQELFLTDLKFTFSLNPLFPAYREGFAPEELSEPPASAGGKFAPVEGGVYEIGFDRDGFCFDNELSRHKTYLNEFSISNRLVTNGEYLEFIEAGGYRDFRFWHSEGWDWVNREGIDSPLYWNRVDGGWNHFSLGGLRKLPLDAPVCHVSFYEAAAFAEWSRMRLPTELEWEVASDRFEWGKRWEWTNSAYLPYPGFSKAAGAVGEYNGKFMINQMVLRGASVATPEGHSRPTYRNFFHPHLRWQFTGIRLAKN